MGYKRFSYNVYGYKLPETLNSTAVNLKVRIYEEHFEAAPNQRRTEQPILNLLILLAA